MISYDMRIQGPANTSSASTIPDHLMCPITHDIFVDPVTTVLGHTYERATIENWFKTNHTDPLTMEKVGSKYLVPNRAIRSAVEEFNKINLANAAI